MAKDQSNPDDRHTVGRRFYNELKMWRDRIYRMAEVVVNEVKASRASGRIFGMRPEMLYFYFVIACYLLILFGLLFIA